MLNKNQTSLGGILLIAGCCIGAGMLGLPVVSALAGFIPSTLAMLICGFFMATTGLLILEATLWFDQEISLISIAGFALGKYGEVLTWCLFLFVFCCLLVAYSAGGGELCSEILTNFLPISPQIGTLIFVLSIGIFVYFGTVVVDYLNRFLMVCLIVTYCGLIAIGLGNFESHHLSFLDWKLTLSVFPIMLVSFGYHNLVPSLTHYLKRNVKNLRKSILIGSFIPFVIYFLWNTVILGSITNSQTITDQISQNKIDLVTGLLKAASRSPYVILLANGFSIFALVTSFLTNALSCIDFLKDGLKIHETSKNRLLLCLVVLVPPLVFSYSSPHLFLTALNYAGGFAVVILFGILPVIIVWYGRYIKKIEAPYTVWGGKFLLGVIFILSLLFLGLEVAQQI